MITAVSEAQYRIEKLWSRGRSNGRKQYAKFGRQIGQNNFKALASAAPYYFNDNIGDVLMSVTNVCTRSFPV